MRKEAVVNTLFQCSAIVLVVAAAAYAFVPQWAVWPFAAGAVGMFAARLTRRYKGKNIRLLRLYRQEAFSSLLLLAAAFLMYWRGGYEWVVLFILATVLQIYTAIFIPREERKENRAAE